MKATVDRIENDIAVLVTHEKVPSRITLPVTVLPSGCREGDIVTVGISRDRTETLFTKEWISRLIDRLRKL